MTQAPEFTPTHPAPSASTVVTDPEAPSSVAAEPEAPAVVGSTGRAFAEPDLRPGGRFGGPVERASDRFAEALQARMMGPRLAAALAAGPDRDQLVHGRGENPAGQVVDANFDPGRRAWVLYRHAGRLVRGDLVLDDPGSPDGAGQADGPTAYTDGHLPVVAPGVRLAVFPSDPDLPTLAGAVDASVLAVRLRAVLGRAADPGARRCRVRLLRYLPGQRATLGLDLAPSRLSYVARVYADPNHAIAVAAVSRALATAAEPKGVLRIAPAVALLPDLATLVHAAVGGVPLDQLWSSRRARTASVPALREGVHRAARALAELHVAPVVGPPAAPVRHELHGFGERAARIAGVDGALGTSLARVAERLLRTQDASIRSGAGTVGLVHGACTPSKFRLNGRRIVLLDLDHHGVAHVASDLGTFLASLAGQEVRHRLRGGGASYPERLAWLGEEFLASYLGARGDSDPNAVGEARWWTAVALERSALRAFARAPRSPLAGALVERAHGCLDQLDKTAVHVDRSGDR
ncbi:hypothetical protein [Actinopolymorpha pittospori]